jgi:RNA polymerase sigma-70 factor (ECF subfamily)
MQTNAPGGAFPATRHSVLQAVRSADPEARDRALATLAAAYWRPAYTYLRLRWRLAPEDAEDAAQDFFARAVEAGVFARYDPAKARLRTYLRTCIDRLVLNERKAEGRLKRGGGARVLSLDFATAEGEIGRMEVPDPVDPEALFRREWVRSVFTLALDRLRAECEAAGKGVQYRLFVRYDVEAEGAGERPSYRALAEEEGIPATQVTNHLHAVRRRFRRCVVDVLRELAGSEDELRAEARELLGVELP